MEIRTSHHQEYMLNSNMVTIDCDKNKMILQSAEISIIKKQMKVSITTIRAELRQKYGRRENVQLRETLCSDILMKLECSENLKKRLSWSKNRRHVSLPCATTELQSYHFQTNKRHDNDNASRVIEEVIVQFPKLTIDMIGNENIEKKQLGKRGFHLNGLGFGLIAGNREL